MRIPWRMRIRKPDMSKSMGPNVLYPTVLRELADVIPMRQLIIFEQSWLLGHMPGIWRRVNVTPISKTGKKEGPGNYRVFSLTSVPGTVM